MALRCIGDERTTANSLLQLESESELPPQGLVEMMGLIMRGGSSVECGGGSRHYRMEGLSGIGPLHR